MLKFNWFNSSKPRDKFRSRQSSVGVPLDEKDRLLQELQVYRMESEQLKRDLREREESRKWHVELYETAPLGYINLDNNGCILDINLTGARMLGVERFQLQNKPLSGWIDIDHLERFENHLQGCRQTTGKVHTEVKLAEQNNSEWVWIKLSSIAVYDQIRKTTTFSTVFSDITEYKKTEEILRKSYNELKSQFEERTSELAKISEAFHTQIFERMRAEANLAVEKEFLSTTLSSIGNGVITTDTEGKIVIINLVAENLTGWANETAIGKYIYEVLYIVNPRTNEFLFFNDFVKKALHSDGHIDLGPDVNLFSKDGSMYIVTVWVAPIKDYQNNTIGVVIIFRDITSQRHLEQELLKIQKLESLGILAGGIAHDFNNFLAGILANVQLSKMKLSKGKDISVSLQRIEDVVSHATGLTKQLLTFAKGGAPIKKVLGISNLIKDVVNFALRGSKSKCEFYLADDLWLVEIDEGQIYQVLNNLVINADQAMPEGGTLKIYTENVSIETTLKKRRFDLNLNPGNYVKITIADQGVGISEENLSKIFDPYFTTKKHGNGLGLTSSYFIIQKHYGYLDVDSKVGVGSNFYIYLPATEKPIDDRTQVTSTVFKGSGKVLLMDDDLSIRNSTGEMLTEIGYQVQLAKDGAEAITLFKLALEENAPFDAVILDLTIPGGMGGKEIAARLLEIESKTKIIVSSGYSNDSVLSNYKEFGFCDVIIKPYKIEELYYKLSKVTINEE